ncbi:MAG: methionyl-tRNA formyltransferase [Candidatus Methanomethylophilaceae archaeon]|nr:methionyl-tRNA formyltransferase [Candidatus Methanomethylophilaceae archaeon]
MRILFMGTPEFGRDILQALREAAFPRDWEIVGAICQPDRPKGRGYRMIPPPVKEYALAEGIPVFQPETLRDEAFASLMQDLSPDLIVVAAFGKILPKPVLEAPTLGCINVHGSLLPAYRGAAPIQRAIMDGCSETGVTIMHMAEGLDTGDMISSVRIPIGENESFGELSDRMGKEGGALLIATLDDLIAGRAKRIPQDEALSSYAAKIEKDDCRLDFSGSARSLHNRIRALSPSPLAQTTLASSDGERSLKIVASRVQAETCPDEVPGTVLSANAKEGCFTVACRTGVLAVTELIPEGKGKMSASDFIRGRKIAPGDRLG